MKPGQRYRLKSDWGADPGGLKAGQVGTVRELVAADELGAHNQEEDCAVLEFEQSEGDLPRAVAIGLEHAAQILEVVS